MTGHREKATLLPGLVGTKVRQELWGLLLLHRECEAMKGPAQSRDYSEWWRKGSNEIRALILLFEPLNPAKAKGFPKDNPITWVYTFPLYIYKSLTRQIAMMHTD